MFGKPKVEEMIPNMRRWRVQIDPINATIKDVIFGIKVIIGKYSLHKYIKDGPTVVIEDGNREYITLVCPRRVAKILSKASGVRHMAAIHDPNLKDVRDEEDG